MGHGPSTEWKKDHAAEVKTRLGIIMFFAYTLIYAGFIFINVLYPRLMSLSIGSLNLAIVYGFGLIILALIQAVIYNQVCTRSEERLEAEAEAKIDSNGGEK